MSPASAPYSQPDVQGSSGHQLNRTNVPEPLTPVLPLKPQVEEDYPSQSSLEAFTRETYPERFSTKPEKPAFVEQEDRVA